MPFFTYPLAWIAAITLPALAAIYFLRHRFRKQSVSTLLLWQMHQESREGGRRIEKPKLPLVFFLELLVLLLLVLAATGPRWQVPSTTPVSPPRCAPCGRLMPPISRPGWWSPNPIRAASPN